MSNVITFPRPAEPQQEPPDDERFVWVCGQCDAYRWKLRQDGTIECADCGHVNRTMGWFFFEPDGAA